MISDVIKLYKKAGSCRDCFTKELGRLPTGSGCRMPQPRYIGPQYWGSTPRIVVCMINPGAGKQVEREFENLLVEFYTDQIPFYKVNDYLRKQMRVWGGGQYERMLTHHLKLDINKIALMNIVLCPMVDINEQNDNPAAAADNCYKRYTSKILRDLQPSIVILSGSSIHRFKQQIEDSVGCDVVLGPHYASRLRLSQLQETYAKIRKALYEGKRLTSK